MTRRAPRRRYGDGGVFTVEETIRLTHDAGASRRVRSALRPYACWLLAGAAAAALTAGQARAAERKASPFFPARTPAAPAAKAPTADDGLGPKDVYIEADEVIDNRDDKLVTANGSVEARYQGRTVRADTIVYNSDTGAAHAIGHAVIVNGDGTVEYGDDVQLDDQLRTGIALGFAARMEDNVTIAAAAAVRRNENVNELSSAIYTACEICKKDGSPKTPTWSVTATKIIQDREHHVVYYRNAVIKVFGVPVLYAPVFWHPDPTSDRMSGLLTPQFSFNSRRGFTYGQPYLWAISPSSDLIVDPQINTKVNPFLNLEYRKRFYSGTLNIRAGYTYEKNFDSDGKFGDTTSRSYILANGEFKPADHWTWGFGAERVSDPTLFVRYRIPDLYVQRGDFTTDTLRLISQIYARRQDQDSFVSVAAMSFQSLRVAQSGRNIYVADDVASFPTVAPLVEGRYNLPRQILGGRLRLQVSAVALDRNDPVASPLTPGAGFLIPATQQAPLNSYLDYTNSRRISASLDWRSSYTFGPGMRAEPFIQARGDLYSLSDPSYVTLDALGNKTTEHADSSVARAVGVVGADFSWPFVRQVGTSSIILEPLVEAAFSPTYKAKANIPNEDSLAFEFEPTNLFSTDRFPGYDLYEGGVRFNVGARASYNLSGGRHASLLVGRVFRTEPNPAFTVQSGLRGTASDWMTALEVTPINGVSLFSRARLDADSFAVRREEAGFNWTLPHGSFGMRYLYNGADALNLKTESLDLVASYFFTKNWGASVTASRDLQQEVWPRTQVSLLYQNDCIQMAVIFTHDQTYDSRIAPSNSVQIRLSLATFGNTTGSGR